MIFSPAQKLAAEALGAGLLLAVVIGSGIMGEALAGGNDAIALLGNTLATAAALVVLILIFEQISGAHFNPAVTLAFLLRREIGVGMAAPTSSRRSRAAFSASFLRMRCSISRSCKRARKSAPVLVRRWARRRRHSAWC
ncbi:MAG: aquaporin [Parvularculaceae bacterium]